MDMIGAIEYNNIITKIPTSQTNGLTDGTRVTLIENFASNAVVQKLVDVKPDRTSPEIL